MKAVVCTQYGGPEVLQLQEVEKPVPKDNEVLIKIRATTVSCADFRIRSFTVPPVFWLPGRLILGIRKPKNNILGLEFAGEVEAVGNKVTLFKKGDSVFAAAPLMKFGAYAEYICIPEGGSMALKPVNTTYEEAAALPVGARTALYYLKKGSVQPGQKVLIYGASGSVGTYAVQLAKYFGAEVTGVCSKTNLDLVNSLGADKVLDYTEKEYTKKLETYDLIVDAVNKCPFSLYNKFLGPQGTYIDVTGPLPSIEMLWTSLTSKKKFVVGENPPETSEDLLFLKGLVEAGSLKPVIDRSYDFDQIVEAHRYVDKGHKKGNVVIKVN